MRIGFLLTNYACMAPSTMCVCSCIIIWVSWWVVKRNTYHAARMLGARHLQGRASSCSASLQASQVQTHPRNKTQPQCWTMSLKRDQNTQRRRKVKLIWSIGYWPQVQLGSRSTYFPEENRNRSNNWNCWFQQWVLTADVVSHMCLMILVSVWHACIARTHLLGEWRRGMRICTISSWDVSQ
jgi:hypothetical protein